MLATSAVTCQSSHTRGCGNKRAHHVSETNIDAGDINVQKRKGIVSANSHQTTDLASGGCQISPLLLRKRSIWKYENQSGYDFLFGFKEGIRALRLNWQLKRELQDLWASDFSAKKKIKSAQNGRPVRWNWTFLLYSWMDLCCSVLSSRSQTSLSSESIIYKPDTSSASTCASQRIIQQQSVTITRHTWQQNYMWQM